MKNNNLRVINLSVAAFLFFFLLGSHVQAKSNKLPVIVSKKIVAQPNSIDHKGKPSISADHTKKPALKPKLDITNIPDNADKDDLFAALSYSKSTSSKPYDPTGKIDPFEPLFYDKPEIKDLKLTPVDSGRANKTQLEKINISQLRLSGLIISKNGNKGLVEESTGKGHVISVGTYVGTRGGKVVCISQDKVTIEEKMKDVYGQIFAKTIELKILKKVNI